MKGKPLGQYAPGIERIVNGAILAGFVIALTSRCLDPYNAPASQHDIRNLVVDGFLNGSNGTCSIQLSRTVSLEKQLAPPAETGATVWLEDEQGAAYGLHEPTSGIYTASNLPFTSGSKVKLRISTKEKVEYQSNELLVLKTPPIDSITWGMERTGVPIYVSTHHNQDESRYYYWKYTETWSYTAGYRTSVKLDKNLNIVPLTESIFQCWNTKASSEVVIASSSTLEDNTGIISRFPVVIVPWESTKLQFRYSVQVEQHAITKETYDYLELLKRNTENLGTLFDPLPSHPIGNIRCLTRPEEIVQGNFTASTVQQRRIYINNSELDRPEGVISVTGYEGCALFEIRMRSDWEHLVPVSVGLNEPVQGTPSFCVDCRLNGGSNIQPDFWVW